MDDNIKFCKVLTSMLTLHLSVIPNLVMGVIECADAINSDRIDFLMNEMLTSVMFL